MEHLLHRRLFPVIARQQIMIKLRQGTLAPRHPRHLRLNRRPTRIRLQLRAPVRLRIIRRPEEIRQLVIMLRYRRVQPWGIRQPMPRPPPPQPRPLAPLGAGPPRGGDRAPCVSCMARLREGPPPKTRNRGPKVYPLLLNSDSHGIGFINGFI